MIEIVLFALTSFGVGLSGALVPGPMFTVTVSDSIKKGFIAGPLIVLGHIMTEILMMVVILAGLGQILGSQTAAFIIGIFGGLVLIFMGYNTYRSNTVLSSIETEENGIQKYGSFIKGIITSVSNPYFFIWWATIGLAFMFKGLALAGILGILAFSIGHWLADLSWFSIISFASSRGSKFMSDKTYNVVMIICGIFLSLLGIYFIISQIGLF
ncbi:LysE family transporter [Methanobacterium sp.]|uniref:LysE family transporter n=1 Tax=Methanobacterium sp. TaxID=2164 RepID=UPI003C760BA0